ncbi:hypothetical protein GLYMA_18G049450v4 [Glycine max]|nr:hypothetical protein GLYMA_18G049450v4 [Glycine max]KAH1153246.1 hypothetical protein GYH30_049067 [Glycine max]
MAEFWFWFLAELCIKLLYTITHHRIMSKHLFIISLVHINTEFICSVKLRKKFHRVHGINLSSDVTNSASARSIMMSVEFFLLLIFDIWK